MEETNIITRRIYQKLRLDLIRPFSLKWTEMGY